VRTALSPLTTLVLVSTGRLEGLTAPRTLPA
jgi:hypothetical protein